MSDFIHIKDVNIPLRYRRDYGDIEGLAKSISLNTLFNPVIVTQNLDLNQGGRRLSALRFIYAVNHAEQEDFDLADMDESTLHIIQNCKDQNIKEGKLRKNVHIKIHNFEDRHEELCMELEENIKRKDLDWKERAMLIKAIDEEKKRLQKQSGSKKNWGVRDTASYLGVSPATIVHDLKIAEALEKGLEDVCNAKDRATALSNVLFIQEQACLAELQRRKEIKLRSMSTTGQLFNMDALECAKQHLKLGEFNHVITDPPYAIEFDEMTSERREGDNYIEMTRDEFYPYMQELSKTVYERMTYGYFICFCAHEHFHRLAAIFEESGFRVSRNPLIWFKKNSPGKNNHPDKHLTSVAEFAVVCWRGMPDLNKPGRSNVYEYANYIDVKQRFHITQKPVELLEDVIETFTRVGETIVDLFMGSGSTIKACIKKKRNYIGNDKSKYFAQARLEILEEETDAKTQKVNLTKADECKSS